MEAIGRHFDIIQPNPLVERHLESLDFASIKDFGDLEFTADKVVPGNQDLLGSIFLPNNYFADSYTPKETIELFRAATLDHGNPDPRHFQSVRSRFMQALLLPEYDFENTVITDKGIIIPTRLRNLNYRDISHLPEKPFNLTRIISIHPNAKCKASDIGRMIELNHTFNIEDYEKGIIRIPVEAILASQNGINLADLTKLDSHTKRETLTTAAGLINGRNQEEIMDDEIMKAVMTGKTGIDVIGQTHVFNMPEEIEGVLLPYVDVNGFISRRDSHHPSGGFSDPQDAIIARWELALGLRPSEGNTFEQRKRDLIEAIHEHKIFVFMKLYSKPKKQAA
jgi:hypothetical protein